MATNEKKKRKVIDINLKLAIISDKKNSVSTTELVKKYNLSASTISTIINERNQEKIRHLTENELIKPDCKRMKLPIYQKIDEAMDLWFKNTIKEKNVQIDGTIIQEQALKFASLKGIPDFKASNGWLDKFKIRHNLTNKKLIGEAEYYFY